MIREAKGVALHDISFWSSTLPLLDGISRILDEYETRISLGHWMQLDASSGRVLHDAVLEVFAARASGRNAWSSEDSHAAQMGNELFEYLTQEDRSGSATINVDLAGCGVVISGSCDLLWPPEIVELKLTAKSPGVRDVRQVLVYAALLHLQGATGLTHGVIANPRLGIAARFDLDELLLMTGGLTLDEFSTLLSQFLVGAGQSG